MVILFPFPVTLSTLLVNVYSVMKGTATKYVSYHKQV